MRICRKANNLKMKSKGAMAMENKLEKIGQNSFMDKVDWLQNSRRRIRWR